jgi:hypothetical protein
VCVCNLFFQGKPCEGETPHIPYMVRSVNRYGGPWNSSNNATTSLACYFSCQPRAHTNFRGVGKVYVECTDNNLGLKLIKGLNASNLSVTCVRNLNCMKDLSYLYE